MRLSCTPGGVGLLLSLTISVASCGSAKNSSIVCKYRFKDSTLDSPGSNSQYSSSISAASIPAGRINAIFVYQDRHLQLFLLFAQ